MWEILYEAQSDKSIRRYQSKNISYSGPLLKFMMPREFVTSDSFVQVQFVTILRYHTF